MRKVLVAFLCSLITIAAFSADYYVSSAGNDSANGLSSSTPWQSISKVNSAFSSFKPGDRILFRRGDRFNGSLKISVSGSSGNPITLGSYGTGSSPVLSGFTAVTGWNNYGGGIYSRAITCESNPNIVTVNNVNTPMGRWPNTGCLSIDSHVTNTSITDSDLPSSPVWTGAEVVIRKNSYIWDRNKIGSHSGNTLQYSSGSYYNAINGYGYFIQNSIKTLDQVGEWYYDGSTFFMYFGNTSPAGYDVKVSTIDQLAALTDRNYITFDNIAFEGANLNALLISNSDYITVQNCSIKFTGGVAISGPWNGTSPGCKIINNSISNSNSNGIKLMGDHTGAVITNNTITETGMIAGMGQSGDGTYNAINVYGDGSLIQNNTIENSGYMGINFSGNNTVVSNNFVNGFNKVKNDGGGIYTYIGTGTPETGQKVVNNIVLNGTGYGDGEPGNECIAFGIYMDDRTRNVTITGNTAANCSSAGIYIHNAHEIVITGNTLFNNGSGNSDFGAQILFVHDSYSPDDPIRNLNLSDNIYFARTTSQKILSFSTASNDIPVFGSSDNNCFAKPLDNSYVARTWSGGWNSTATNRLLADWQSYTGKDRNSFISPLKLTDVNKIRFEYNATNSGRTVTLDNGYIDVKGKKYAGTITLLPYTSVVLMVDPNASTPPPPPPAPVYVGSVIENATPARLEMTYSLTLAGTMPATSAFAVRVNSTVRTVSSVAVSGTKVTLTLSSPVVYGNTITVAYTKPSSNPLQTSAGGQAVTISAQTVTNKVADQAVTPPAAINTPPIAVVNYTKTSYSGFVNELNASGSYDENKDNLTYTWSAPSDVDVSATKGSVIKYLTPAVSEPKTIVFTLNISDGKTTQTKSVSVEVLPYRPDLQLAQIIDIEASGYQSPNYPQNIIDGDISTMWSVSGDNQWIIAELKEPFNIQHVNIAFKSGQARETYFEVYGSEDSVSWEPILEKSSSCYFSGNPQVFDFPASKTTREYRFVKLVGHGNATDSWNYISEFRIFGQNPAKTSEYEDQPVKIYPNPASDYVNVRIDEPSLLPDFFRLISLSGKVLFEEVLDPGLKEFRIPLELMRGIYIIQMGAGKLTLFTQKLIITR